MNFEKYGNKLDNLLYEIEKRLPSVNTNEVVQMGGGDGPESTTSEDGIYSKILSYSVNHVSVLVHLDKNDSYVAELENPQIYYNNADGTIVSEYSIEQQLRLGCDNEGNTYNYSIVLTRKLKIEEIEQEQEQKQEGIEGREGRENKVKESLGKLGNSLSELSLAVQKTSAAVDIEGKQ